MRRLVLGETMEQVARDLGLQMSSLQKVVNSPMFKKEMAKMHELVDSHTFDAMLSMRRLQPDAIDVIEELLGMDNRPDLRLQAAKEVLNRTGVVEVRRYDISRQSVSYEERLQVTLNQETPKLLGIADSIDLMDVDELSAIEDVDGG